MKIVVYEHLTGGGYAQQPFSANVLAEGFAMLRCVAADFKAAGHEVTVLLDQRISKLNLPLNADYIVPVAYSHEPAFFLSDVAKINDALFLIAPETDGTLQKLVALVEKTGKTSLNCTSKSIGQVSDKTVLYGQLEKNGISTPKTAVLNNAETLEFIRHTIEESFFYPVVFKPIDGTGCGGVSLVCSNVEIGKAIDKIKSQTRQNKFIVQEYLTGESASVSVLCNGKYAQAVSLNKQTVNLNAPFTDSCYLGGTVPIEHHLKHEAFSAAERVVKLFSGLRGYVGVDVILTENKVYILDLNPRLTTSYVGLTEVSEKNAGKALIDAATNGQYSEFKVSGVSCFGKLQSNSPSMEAFYKMCNETVVSPLFPFTTSAVALLRGCGSNLREATRRLEEAKKSLRSIMC